MCVSQLITLGKCQRSPGVARWWSVALALGPGTLVVTVMGVMNALITGLAYGFGGIIIALTYARLREIKEGVAVDQIATIFE